MSDFKGIRVTYRPLALTVECIDGVTIEQRRDNAIRLLMEQLKKIFNTEELTISMSDLEMYEYTVHA